MSSGKKRFQNEKTDNGKGKDKIPFFQRVGTFVSKNYKFILIIWFVIVGACIYPALRLNKVLSYNELEFLPDDLDYHEGEAIYDSLFPSNSTGTTIIVIQSIIPIAAAENIHYIEELTTRIFEEYGDVISEFQSVLTVLDAFNATYWNTIENSIPIVNETIYPLILTGLNEINETRDLLDYAWKQMADIYLMTWFNFSRTYYYGLYNSTLFDTGPVPTVYDMIEQATNYSIGQSISTDYVDTVYNTINTELSENTLLNDSVLHNITLTLTNAILFNSLETSLGLSLSSYNELIYPSLVEYNSYWNQSFYQQITSLGTQIINGTSYTDNYYQNTTLNDAYQSQEEVLLLLESINETAYSNLNLKSTVCNLSLNIIDISSLIAELDISLLGYEEELIAAIDPLIPIIVQEIYDLGPNPTSEEIIILINSVIDDLINAVIAVYPPPEDIMAIHYLLRNWVLSSDGLTTLILISYDAYNKTIDEIDAMVKETDAGIGALAYALVDELNLQRTNVYHTGDQMVTDAWVTQAEEDARLIDIFTIIFVLIILLIIFCSFIAPIIPLIAIGASVVVSMAFLWLISFTMDVHFMATLFLTVTSLGAGVDYCIFIFSRYNEERKKGYKKEEAIITAVRYAGESVFHSGLTVIVGFGAMIIPNFPLLRILGISMCIGITISIISALLVVPSIILVLGDAIWWPKFLQTAFRPQKWFKKKKIEEPVNEAIEENPDGKPTLKIKDNHEKKEPKKRFIIRFANTITKNGLTITILAFVVIIPFIYLTATMDTSTDFMGMLPKDFDGTLGRNILSENMPVGDPTSIKLLLYDLPLSPYEKIIQDEISFLCYHIENDIDGVATVTSLVKPFGGSFAFNDPLNNIFAQYSLGFIGSDNRSTIIEIYLFYSPYAKETELIVSELPETVEGIFESSGLTTLQQGKIHCLGYARALYEIKLVTDKSFPIVLPVVIIGVYLVLFFLFGSYFTPLRLILTIAFSIVITLGLLQLVFSLGFNVPIFWLLPLMLFSILMGLGLDYDIFLVTRIKEYYDKGMSNKEAIAHALDHTASIITSCGTLMAAAYSSLLISQLWHLRELGFAFAIAIILDATIIRLVFVPAVMVLMEKYNWIGPKLLMKLRHQHPESLENNDKDIVGEIE
ncbi:MAG: MMPL family transporter [Asgard group archaeon]|nr:MMPL family transporter [Asgard group archaeon]